MPDAYELNFPSNVGDAAFDEQLRLIGNGVPVPLAAAFGRALEDALEPDVAAYLEAHPNAAKGKRKGGAGTGNVWERRWREIGSEALCARSGARSAASPSPPSDEARARRHDVGSGWAASSSSSSSSSSSVMRSASSDEASTGHGERDETDRTSYESGALDSPRRAQVKGKGRAIEVHGSDSESESGSERWVRQRGAARLEPDVIDLCDSDSDSD